MEPLYKRVLLNPMKTYTSALIGVTGYAICHYRNLLREAERGRTKILGAVVINRNDAAPQVERLNGLGCRIFDSADELFSELNGKIDLCCIPVGIPYHAKFTCEALKAGANVLVEKPLAPTMAEVKSILSLEKSQKRFVAVGFQFCHSRSTRLLKKRILAGEFGHIVSMKTICLSPRGDNYYNRNPWAGKKTLADGTPVLDSPFGNGMAHQLHMALFLAGETEETSAMPHSVSARQYRANPIESCDTSVLKIILEKDVPLFCCGSHAADVNHDPELVIECEKARLCWTYPACHILFGNGRSETIENDSNDLQYENLYESLYRRFCGENSFLCSVRNAASHSACIDLAFKDGGILDFPPETITYDPDQKVRTVRGLGAAILNAWEKELFPPALPGI